MRILHASDRAYQFQLHIKGQGGGNTIGIQLVGGQAFRLDEHLVRFLVGKAMDLVFNRGAITGSHTLDHASVHRRTIQVVANDLVGLLVGMAYPAIDLLGMFIGTTQEGHHRHRRITRLGGHLREIHTAPVNPRRGAGFQTINP